jgi:long-chain acyl-CoA synthetase
MSCFPGDKQSGFKYTEAISDAGDGSSAILRGKNGVAGLYEGSETVRNCYDIFLNGKTSSGDEAPCLGYRPALEGGNFGPYNWLSYGEVDKRARAVGSGLINLGLVPEITFEDESQQGGKWKFLCCYSKNRPEWSICELAGNTQGVTIVPMYDTLGLEGLKFIIGQTKLTTIACAGAVFKHVLALAETKESSIVNAIIFDPITDEQRAAAKTAGLNVFSFEEVEKAGEANPRPFRTSTADDVCLLMFTSGTTGNPKGVMTTNRMICSMLPKLNTISSPLGPGDCMLSYLPAAHVFDRMTNFVVFFVGGKVGFNCGDVTKILEDCEKLQPTVFPAVPRVLNRFHGKIMDKIRALTGLKRYVVDTAMSAKMAKLDRTGEASHWFYDLFFGVFRGLLGGKVRLMVCGAAPIAPSVLRDFRCFFSCPVIEVYGMTETTGGGCLASDRDPTPEGGVGAPNTEAEAKLVSVPDMKYIADDLSLPCQGEICFRGPCITPGYFRAKDLTAETIDKDGWLHTGDVGLLMKNGGIKVIDRKKNIFKLAQGEYLAPEKIEQTYLHAPCIGQIFLYGDSNEVYHVAIVVLNEDWMKSRKAPEGETELDLKNEVKNMMSKAADDAKLHGFERAKEIHISKEAFTIDNNLLTPTQKIKRHDAKLHYATQIADMYAKIKASAQ